MVLGGEKVPGGAGGARSACPDQAACWSASCARPEYPVRWNTTRSPKPEVGHVEKKMREMVLFSNSVAKLCERIRFTKVSAVTFHNRHAALLPDESGSTRRGRRRRQSPGPCCRRARGRRWYPWRRHCGPPICRASSSCYPMERACGTGR